MFRIRIIWFGLATGLFVGAGTAIAQDALFVDPLGNVGIGTNLPTAPLTIARNEFGDQTMFSLINRGHSIFRLQDTSQPNVRWEFRTAGTQGQNERFIMNKIGSGRVEMSVFHNGNVQIAGALFQGSSRSIKNNIRSIDSQVVLDMVTKLPLHKWSYLAEQDTIHLGPMAEDFFALFGLGLDASTISPTDLASVAVAAVQGLSARFQTEISEREQKIDELYKRNELLEQRMVDLENRMLVENHSTKSESNAQ